MRLELKLETMTILFNDNQNKKSILNRKDIPKSELLYDPKIRSSIALGNSIQSIKRRDPTIKIGFANGKYRFLHTGHCVFLKLCKTQCDILIVAVNSDYSLRVLKQPSIHKDNERMFSLACLSYVDYVTMFDEDDPYACITKVTPDIIFKGPDYKNQEVVCAGKEVVVIDMPDFPHCKDLENIKNHTEPVEELKFFKL